MAIDNAFVLLFLGLINGASIGGLLLFKKHNKLANLILSGFIFSLVLRMLIYIAGAQGVYDPHSWLYVPSVEISLVYGPFVYLYVMALISRRLPAKCFLHFVPMVAQVSYYLILLILPTRVQFEWVQFTHLPYIVHLESLLVIGSMAGYFYAAWLLYRNYLNWLGNKRSDLEDFRLPWLKRFINCSALFLGCWAGFLLFDFWAEFSYQRHFLLFAAMSFLLTYLAFESWRHSDQVLPEMNQGEPTISEKDKHPTALIVHAEAWFSELQDQKYWQDPELSLSALARKLGTNTSALSAAFNQYKGENFNAVINRLRTESVCEKIEAGVSDGELLKVALEEGFNSKNSFNRSFKRFTGMTPSQFRQKYGTRS